MNKSDFISDAVALDLGKSGVKVAETLEIEVGREWWRLINSANITVAQVFDNRQLAEPVVSGGEINLAPMIKDIGAFGKPKDTLAAPFSGIAWDKETMTPFFYTLSNDSYVGGDVIVRVFNKDGDLINSITGTDTTSFVLLGAFWDHVNQRIIVCLNYPSNSRPFMGISCGLTSESTSYWGPSYTWSGMSSVYPQPKVFAEAPNYIYCLFKQTAGTLNLKKVAPVLGQSALSVCHETATMDGTVITVASNYRENEAEVFYSRKHESVGVAWVDSSSGFLYYALESENWETAYLLSQVTSGAGVRMSSFGNMVLPSVIDGGGEYYVAGLKKQEDGVLTRQSGYSLPANLNILGATRGDSDGCRILGNVSSDWYIFSISYANMNIEKVSEPYNVGFSPESNYAFVKIGESGDRELFVTQIYRTPRTMSESRGAVLVCYDKSTGNIVWSWGVTEWSDSTLFPSTYNGAYRRQQMFQRVKTTLLFMQIWKATLQTSCHVFEYYPVSIEAIANCATASAVSSLLVNRKIIPSLRALMPEIYRPYDEYPWNPPAWQNTTNTWGESFDYYSFMLASSLSSDISSAGFHRMFNFNKSTWELVSITGVLEPARNTKLSAGATKFDLDTKSYSYNLEGTDPKLDTYIRICSGSTVSFLNEVLGTVASNSIIGGTYPVFVAVNTYGASYTLYATGKTVYCTGLTKAADGNAGSTSTITLPHDFSKYMVNEFEDVALFLGQVTNGEIPYTKTGCLESDTIPSLAINAEDFSDTYTINRGFQATGGEHTLNALGSWMIYRDVAGMLKVVTTGATIDESMGGTGEPVEGDSAVYVYNYQSNRFFPYPFAREGIKVELSNISKMTKITLPETQTDLIRTMLASGTDFRGSRCILRRIFPDHADERGADIVLLDGYIQDWSYSPEKKGILFTVSKTLIDVGASFPKRLMNMSCSHVFKGVRCGYLGEDGICTKTKTDCTSKGAVTRFGGFPWVAARQRRVMWR